MELCQKGSLLVVRKALNYLAFTALFLGCTCGVRAQETETFDASGDYITDCKYASCVKLQGSRWSKSHIDGVAVSVRMGTQPVVSDDKIKEVITKDFRNNGINDLKFFFDHIDAPASGVSFHVRGGTEGPYLIGQDLRDRIPQIAHYLKNPEIRALDLSVTE